MKRSMFDEETSKALSKWRKNAKKKSDEKPPPVPTPGLGGDSSSHDPSADHDNNDRNGSSNDHP